MADYINQNIICQAYIHVESVNLGENQLEDFRQYVSEFITARGRFFLYPEVEIDVELKEGSLKSYATVLGTVAALYTGVATYPDFREGVSLIHEDCRRLSESVISESLFMAKARNKDIIRVEARTGVVGSLKGAVNDIDLLIKQNGDVSPKEMTKRLQGLRDDVLRLLDNLHSEEDKNLVARELEKLVRETPPVPKPPPKGKEDAESVQLYREERNKLIVHLRRRAS